MTIDDDKSIFVGGIRYDCTEDDLRRAFQLYGSIIAVKINADRSGRSCYGFVTFTNPRAVANAIHDMNGRAIGGRRVNVNEVRTRGAGVRSNHGSETLQTIQRGMVMNRHRSREQDHGECDRGHSRDRSRKREREDELASGDEHAKCHIYDRDEDVTKDEELSGGGNIRKHGHESEKGRDDSHHRKIEKEKHDSLVDIDSRSRGMRRGKDQHLEKSHRSSSCDQRSREISSESNKSCHQIEEKLDAVNQRCKELLKENSEMEQKLVEKNQLIVDLRRRAQKLEDSLMSTKKAISLHRTQLTKLRKSFLQMKDGVESRLKSSEREFQALVESMMQDVDSIGDGGSKDEY